MKYIIIRASIDGQMAESTRVIGLIIICTVRVNISGLMGGNMSGSMHRIKRM